MNQIKLSKEKISELINSLPKVSDVNDNFLKQQVDVNGELFEIVFYKIYSDYNSENKHWAPTSYQLICNYGRKAIS